MDEVRATVLVELRESLRQMWLGKQKQRTRLEYEIVHVKEWMRRVESEITEVREE